MNFRLIQCDATGNPVEPIANLPPEIAENCKAASPFFESVGFDPPWVGFIAVADGVAVGGGAFKGPPKSGKVEIAYYMLSEFQNRGFGTETARQLVAIAHAAAPEVQVTAQTLPEPSASTSILQKLGFNNVGTIEHPDDGPVWEWHFVRG